MAKFSNQGSRWQVFADINAVMHDRLPAGTYAVKLCNLGYYLEQTEMLTASRAYGDALVKAERILKTYLSRGKNTGVLAVGEKGTGKTFLARLVAEKAAAEHGIPTLIVDSCFCDEAFKVFLTTIQQPTIVLLEEFEKTYKEEAQQEALLTLLDGVYQSNKLFLFTANNKYRLNRCLLSRPGRILYYLAYGPVTQEFVRDYCTEHLNDRSKIASVVNIAGLYGNFSFDIVKALVEEMNRYKESAQEAMRYLNIQLELEGTRKYSLTVWRDGERCELANYGLQGYMRDLNPAGSNINLELTSDGDELYAFFDSSCLVSMHEGGRLLEYRNLQGYTLKAVEVQASSFDPWRQLAAGY